VLDFRQARSENAGSLERTVADFRISNAPVALAARGRAMPKYFFVVRHQGHISGNSEGIDFPDLNAARLEALKSTGELLRELSVPLEAGSEWRMEVADETRRPIFSLRVIAEFQD
jgi:hypothetical protein